MNLPNIGINVSGALDADGNVQTTYSGTNNFSIDTLDPATAPPAVLGAAPSVATVTDKNVGTAAFSVRIVYSAAMNTNFNPAVTFTPSVASTLTFDRAWSWWTSDRTFVVRYDVADANVVAANISIEVASALDATGNVQMDYYGAAAFSIDTLNPPPGAVVLVAGGRLSKSSYAVGRISNPSYTDAVLSSGALNLSIGTPSAPTSQQSAINPVDRAVVPRHVAGGVSG